MIWDERVKVARKHGKIKYYKLWRSNRESRLGYLFLS